MNRLRFYETKKIKNLQEDLKTHLVQEWIEWLKEPRKITEFSNKCLEGEMAIRFSPRKLTGREEEREVFSLPLQLTGRGRRILRFEIQQSLKQDFVSRRQDVVHFHSWNFNAARINRQEAKVKLSRNFSTQCSRNPSPIPLSRLTYWILYGVRDRVGLISFH